MADHADELRLVIHSNSHYKDGESSVSAEDFPGSIRHDVKAQVAHERIVINRERRLSRRYFREREGAADREALVAVMVHVGKKVAKLFPIVGRRVAHEAALADNRVEAMRRCVESHVEKGHKQ